MNKDEVKRYEDQYPEGYIKHYLAMYSIHQDDLLDENFENQNKLYIEFEGKEEFQNLVAEVVLAEKQEDLDLFLKAAIFYQISDIDLTDLKRMFEAIKLFKT